MKNRLKNPLGRMNIKRQMILLFLVLVIPLFALNAYGNSMAGQILKRHVTNAYIELNKQNFKLINRDIETVNKVTSTVIQNSQIQRLDPFAEDTVLARVKTTSAWKDLCCPSPKRRMNANRFITRSMCMTRTTAISLLPITLTAEKRGYIFLRREGEAGMVR